MKESIYCTRCAINFPLTQLSFTKIGTGADYNCAGDIDQNAGERERTIEEQPRGQAPTGNGLE